jgi:hypothetical protein
MPLSCSDKVEMGIPPEKIKNKKREEGLLLPHGKGSGCDENDDNDRYSCVQHGV